MKYFRVGGPNGPKWIWAESEQGAETQYSAIFNLGAHASVYSYPEDPPAGTIASDVFGGAYVGGEDGERGPIQDEGDVSLEMIDPSAAYLQHLGTLGFDVASATPGLRQQAAERQQQPMFDLFRGRQLASGNVLGDVSPEQYEQQWQGFLGQQAGPAGLPPSDNYFPGATSQDLMSQFGQLETQGQGAMTARQRAMYDPREGASYGGPISGLGISALQQSMSPLMPGMGAVPSETDLWRRWRATRGEGAAPEDKEFTDYVRSQLGLSAFA